jgi:hypothetical protein
MLNIRTLDAQTQEKMAELLARDPQGLSKDERKLLEARSGYLTTEQKVYFGLKEKVNAGGPKVKVVAPEPEQGEGQEGAEGTETDESLSAEEDFEDLDENGLPKAGAKGQPAKTKKGK